jgi:hypothetical protein
MTSLPRRRACAALVADRGRLRRRRYPLGRSPISAVTGEGQVLAAVLWAGRYATLWHTGHPDGLVGATRTLLDWAAQQGLAWDVTSTPDGELGRRGEASPAASPQQGNKRHTRHSNFE